MFQQIIMTPKPSQVDPALNASEKPKDEQVTMVALPPITIQSEKCKKQIHDIKLLDNINSFVDKLNKDEEQNEDLNTEKGNESCIRWPDD